MNAACPAMFAQILPTSFPGIIIYSIPQCVRAFQTREKIFTIKNTGPRVNNNGTNCIHIKESIHKHTHTHTQHDEIK